MGIKTGLAALQKAASGAGERRSGAGWLKLKDGESMTIRFLQELDTESPGYNKEAGVGILVSEWSHADNFSRKAVDTSDEGACWMQEQADKEAAAGIPKDKRKWKKSTRLYINVLNVDTNEVLILAQGLGPKSVVPWLIEWAGDEGTITNREFRIKRTGSGRTDTSYSLMPKGSEDSEPYDPTQHELADLGRIVKEIPYEEQAEYFADVVNSNEENENDSW